MGREDERFHWAWVGVGMGCGVLLGKVRGRGLKG